MTDPTPNPLCNCDLCRQTRLDAESERIVAAIENNGPLLVRELDRLATGLDVLARELTRDDCAREPVSRLKL